MDEYVRSVEMSIKKLIGCEVSIQTGLASLRDIKGTVTDIMEELIELREPTGKTIWIPFSSCGVIRIEKDGKDVFKKTEL